jgi:hypothetical protein
VNVSGPTTDEIDVDRLADAVTMLADKHDLLVVPAMPIAAERAPMVTLNPSDASVEWFVSTAAAAGCRLLYVSRRRFALDHMALLAAPCDEQDHARPEAVQILRLRASASDHEGHACELGLAFSTEGVLHRWIAMAGWYDRLRADVIDAADSGAPPPNVGRPWPVQEQTALLGRFREGSTIKMLAVEFGRSAGAIRARLQKLGVVDL